MIRRAHATSCAGLAAGRWRRQPDGRADPGDPKPALPFAGAFRLIDVPLSNLRNSGISDVWVSVQYLGQRLSDAMANGKPWDLDRHHGGFRVIMPQQAGPPAEEGFVSGNAEELLSNRDAIRRHGADAVLVLSADHVYRLDYAEVVAEHLAGALSAQW